MNRWSQMENKNTRPTKTKAETQFFRAFLPFLFCIWRDVQSTVFMMIIIDVERPRVWPSLQRLSVGRLRVIGEQRTTHTKSNTQIFNKT